MVITGGENVYTAEIEETIYEYGKVESVAVVPAPDSIYGAIGCAYIVPKSGFTINEADLKEFLLLRLAKFKIPKIFVFRSELPLNPTGKIAKNVLNKEGDIVETASCESQWGRSG